MALTVPVEEIVASNANGLLGARPSWERIPLGQLAAVQNGAAFKSEHFNTEGRGLPLLRIRDVLSDRTDAFYDGPYEPELIVNPGDLVVGMDGDFNCAQWRGPRALLNQRVCRIGIKNDQLNPKFLALLLPGYLAAINVVTSSVTVKHLSSRTVKQIPVPVPARAEQDRVVDVVEARASRLDDASTLVNDSVDRLSALRRSVLDAAVRGSWERVALDDVLLSLRNGIFVSRPAARPPGIPIFRISAVRPMALDVTDVRYAPAGLEPDDNFFAQDGDLLFTRYSGNPNFVGACGLVEALPEPILYPDKLIRAVVDRSVADPGFLQIACSAGETLAEIISRRKTTAGQVGIAGGQLKNVSVPLPPLEVQRAINASARVTLHVLGRTRRDIESINESGQQLRIAILRSALGGCHGDAQTSPYSEALP